MERILIADDNEGARALLTSLLESRGYDVTVTCDGFEALEQLQQGKSAPDLMLLDIEMPRMDGCEVCTHVKSRADTRGIPVVLVSGLVDTADRASEAGADGFVHKPYKLDTLLSEVRRQLPALRRQSTEPREGAWLSRLDCARLSVAAT